MTRSLPVLGVAALLLAPPATAQDEAAGDFSAAGVRKFRKDQRPPVSLGTSGGNANAFDGMFCSSGTLGFLVEKDGAPPVQYVVSNNHVIALENEAKKGDPINQPGLIDEKPACLADPDNFIASLTGWKKIKFGTNKSNKVDVAIAEVIPGMVKTSGRLLKIGIPGNFTIAPTVGLEVKKAGRTTGFSRGEIGAVNVTGIVNFSAADGSALDAVFRNQFTVETNDFLGSGDSGSGVFKNVARCPALVGLAFAANEDGWALVNRADDVLKAIRRIKPRGEARVVGCTPEPELAPAAASIRSESLPDLRAAMRVQRRWEDDLLELPEVVGIGIGRAATDPTETVFKVYVAWSDDAVRERVPARFGRFRTELVESGPWIAY